MMLRRLGPSESNCFPIFYMFRLVSYYEISILKKPNDGNGDEYSGDGVAGQPRLPADVPPTRHSNDCVAVGLATESFHVHSRMPGWDRRSFGYHGDDSGLFHASGTMVRHFGERFGAGDIVGCGVSYTTKSIFFTLNGKFLGDGFSGIDEEFLKNDLFPVVGVDTNCPIHLNLGGEKPFAFDLASFIMKDENTIASSYRWKEETVTSAIRRGSISSSLSSSTRSLGCASSPSGHGGTQPSSKRRFSLGRIP
jgi:SPRY domain